MESRLDKFQKILKQGISSGTFLNPQEEEGILTKIVREKMSKSLKFTGLGLKLPEPGTAVLWPGETAIHSDGSLNILFFFRGGSSNLMNQTNTNAVVVTADAGGIGGGPSEKTYGNASFVNNTVNRILEYVQTKTGKTVHLGKLGFAGWSGGYAPMGAILAQRTQLVKQPDFVAAFDGMHYGKQGSVDEKEIAPWQQLAEDAANGKTTFVFTHSAVKPNYSSTTDAANYFVKQNNMTRQPVQEWDSTKSVKPASMATKGNFTIAQLYDKEDPYKVDGKVNVKGTAGQQHIDAIRGAATYMPNWP